MSNALAAILDFDPLAAAAPFYGAPTAACGRGQGQGGDPDQPRRPSMGKPGRRLSGPGKPSLKKNNVRYEGHLAGRTRCTAFNDATPERYNKVTAPQAWGRTIDWFDQYHGRA